MSTTTTVEGLTLTTTFRIMIRRLSAGCWMATTEQRPVDPLDPCDYYGAGSNPREALGDLLLTFKSVFGIPIEVEVAPEQEP